MSLFLWELLVKRLSGLPPSAVAGHTHAGMRRDEEIRHFPEIIFQFEASPTGTALRALLNTLQKHTQGRGVIHTVEYS